MAGTELMSALEHLAHSKDSAWVASLGERKLDESRFHDGTRGSETHALDANKKYYETTGLSTQYLHKWIADNAKGNVVLDYACGDGPCTIRFAQAGAALAVGLDISPVSIEKAKERAKAMGADSNPIFVVGDCENTELPANSVDRILCSGMLHHLDLSYAIPEMRRILKPGGRCLAVEALAYNPAIKLYRKMTPSLRTKWESKHIISLKDLRFIRRFMSVENVHYWHLASVGSVLFRGTPFFRPALAIANAIDRAILKVPPLSYLAWIITFEIVKR